MSQERVHKTKTVSKQISEETTASTKKVDEAEVAKIKAETDELLDAIDAVLEENAQEFIQNYVQKGGQ